MKQPVKLDDFLNFKFLSALSFSPDGKHCAFLAHRFDLSKDGYSSELYIYSVPPAGYIQAGADFLPENTGPKALAYGLSSFCWIDEQHIVFPAAREEAERVYREKDGYVSGFYCLDIRNGDIKKLFSLPLNVGEIKFNNGHYIFNTTVVNNRPDVESMSCEEAEKALTALKKEQNFQIFEEHPFWMNGKGIVSGTRNAVFTCTANGEGLKRLGPVSLEVMGFVFHNTEYGGGVAMFGADYEEYRSDRHVLYHVSFDGDLKTLIADDLYSIKNICSLGECLVVAASENKRFGASENPCFYIVDNNGNMKQIADPDISVVNAAITDCRYGGGDTFRASGGKLYFVSTIGSDACLCCLNEKGELEIFRQQGAVDFFDVYDDKLAAICMKGLRLEELYLGKLGSELRRVSEFNEKFYQETELSGPEHFTFVNTDGVEIDGWIMKPYAFDENKKYPSILNIHGGPKAVYGSIYFHEMQIWAAMGFVVFFCNPRGSDGKGNSFARVDGKFCSIDYDDFMQFTDAVLARSPYIDKTRMGITGGSYGGYMTNYIITQTDRFAAAVSQRSVSSWLTTIFTCDGGFHLAEDQLDGAKIWDEKSWEKLWAMSPIRYADKVKTPTLFLHSEYDYRTWVVEGIMMYAALAYHRVPTRMHVFKNENHNLSRSGRPSNRKRRLEEIINWFERYLK